MNELIRKMPQIHYLSGNFGLKNIQEQLAHQKKRRYRSQRLIWKEKELKHY